MAIALLVHISESMRVSKTVLKDCIAATCLVVMEVLSPDGVHNWTYLAEQSVAQFYDALGSDHNAHYQITEGQLPSYRNNYLRVGGFVEAETTEDARRCFRRSKRRWVGKVESKYFCVLDMSEDHYLDNLVVVNSVSDDVALRGIMDAIPFEAIAKKMFVDDYERLLGNAGVRSNLRYDAGFSPSDQTDPGVVEGMYFPKRMVQAAKMEGIDKDANFEETMYRSALGVMRISDLVQQGNPNPGDRMAKPAFTGDKDGVRNSFFSRKWALDLGIEENLLPFARFEGTSMFGTGGGSDHRFIKTERHVDVHNDAGEGHNHSPTLTAIVPVVFPDGRTEHVRIGINCYRKACCASAMERLEANNAILKLVNERANRSTSNDMYKLFDPPKGAKRKGSIYSIPAHDNKDAMYSLYVNSINDACKRLGGRDRGFMLESLLTVTLTPAPDGWFKIYKHTANAFAKHDGKTGRNAYYEYIHQGESNYGTVTHGDCLRNRVSHRGGHDEDEFYISCQNFDRILKEADNGLPTKTVLKKMAKSAKKGGILGVGPYYAQVVLNLAMKLGLVENPIHHEYVVIAPSTTTYTRLCRYHKIKGERHAREIVGFLRSKLGLPGVVVENKVCEVMRAEHGSDNKRDVFVTGHVLYLLEEGGVYTQDRRGVKTLVTYREATEGLWYHASVVWWKKAEVLPHRRVTLRKRARVD